MVEIKSPTVLYLWQYTYSLRYFSRSVDVYPMEGTPLLKKTNVKDLGMAWYLLDMKGSEKYRVNKHKSVFQNSAIEMS